MCPYLNLDPHQARILSDQKYGSVKSSPLVSPKCRCRQNNHSSEPTWPQSKRTLVHLRFPWSWWECFSSQMILSPSSEWIKLTMKPKRSEFVHIEQLFSWLFEWPASHFNQVWRGTDSWMLSWQNYGLVDRLGTLRIYDIASGQKCMKIVQQSSTTK